ncbi:interferon-induced protein with tetratricopeptide repeats 5-like [Anolis sagrei]|uniref:interferon-induced protein with tetratricopeptide repeats 5-like n=1 Tax=Anolis sagrei TaxID=38937 RepID=UPI003522B6DB
MGPLKEKLQSLQCHFTWSLEVRDKVDAEHNLQTLRLRLEHTSFPNRGAYLALKAYLHHLQEDNNEALESLQEAEEALRKDHPTNFSRQALVTYGNFAWIYYHLTNYEKVELYLEKIHETCQALSSPEPYSVAIPEIHAQKGWSLLAWGFRNGQEAKMCFLLALRGDGSNGEYQAGLAYSAFALWCHTMNEEFNEEAQRVLEEVLVHQPQNAEAKVYLANVIMRKDRARVKSLVEDVAQNSLNPEVLRNAAKVWGYLSLPLSWAIAVLEKAIALGPSYHLLYYDLGVCYTKQMKEASQEEREELVAKATKIFKQALEKDPFSVFSQLELAKLYGEKSLADEEEIYQNLMEDLPNLSQRCQQAIYLHWGDFLLHKKRNKEGALEMYTKGFQISGGHGKEQSLLKGRLLSLAKLFQKESETGQANRIYEMVGLPHEERFQSRFGRIQKPQK